METGTLPQSLYSAHRNLDEEPKINSSTGPNNLRACCREFENYIRALGILNTVMSASDSTTFSEQVGQQSRSIRRIKDSVSLTSLPVTFSRVGPEMFELRRGQRKSEDMLLDFCGRLRSEDHRDKRGRGCLPCGSLEKCLWLVVGRLQPRSLGCASPSPILYGLGRSICLRVLFLSGTR